MKQSVIPDQTGAVGRSRSSSAQLQGLSSSGGRSKEEVVDGGASAVGTLEQSTASGRHGVRLSNREIEILRHIAEGNRTKEVANILFVSKRTIDYHLANAYQKLGVSNRIQAILLASRMGLISTEPTFSGAPGARAGIERELISHCPEQHMISYENVEQFAQEGSRGQ